MRLAQSKWCAEWTVSPGSYRMWIYIYIYIYIYNKSVVVNECYLLRFSFTWGKLNRFLWARVWTWKFEIQEIAVDISLFCALIYIIIIFFSIEWYIWVVVHLYLGDSVQMSIKYHYDPEILSLVPNAAKQHKDIEPIYELSDIIIDIRGPPKKMYANLPDHATPLGA